MKIEDNPAFAEKPFRICSVLCPENPLKIGEEFQIKDFEGKYLITPFGEFVSTTAVSNPIMLGAFCHALNRPEKIIRRPQFSDDEKALFKAFHALGYDYWARTVGGYLYVCKGEPELLSNGYLKTDSKNFEVDSDFLPSIGCNQKLNAAAYLESEESK